MNKRISFFVKVGMLVLSLAVALPALAGWSDVPANVTKDVCPSSVPGCNTPINVSINPQVKAGALGVYSLNAFSSSAAATGTALSSRYDRTTGENYGGNFGSYKVGLYTKGTIGLYSTDLSHSGGGAFNTRIPLTLYKSTLPADSTVPGTHSLQWSGYFDGNVNINGSLQVCDTNGANCQTITNINGTGTNLPTGTSGQTLRYDSSNALIANSNLFNDGTNIGIGTAAPAEKLSIYGASAATNIDIGSNSVRRWKIGAKVYNSAKNKYDLVITPKDWQGDLVLNDGTYAGNVGIGKNDPSTKLEVVGKILASGTGADVCVNTGSGEKCLGSGSSGTTISGTTNYVTKFATASTLGNSSIFDNGNVGVGTTNPGTKLDVSGEVRAHNLYGDGISLGGDNSANDLQVNIYAPSTRNEIHFWNQSLAQDADIAAGNATFFGNVKIVGGTPASNKILASTDSVGDATWKTATELGISSPHIANGICEVTANGSCPINLADSGFTPGSFNHPIHVMIGITHGDGSDHFQGSISYTLTGTVLTINAATENLGVSWMAMQI